jgi:sugar phosphate isomerase/epimerase
VFTLSAFADEIGPELTEQMDVLEREGVRYIELRNVWKKNVLDLSDEEVGKVKKETKRRGFGISSIGSPIGKIQVTDPFDEHIERFRRAVWTAKELGAPYIRLFSYYMPEGEGPARHRDEVMRRMRAKAAIAEEEAVTLLHENEKDIYGDTGERCRDVLETVRSERLRMAFDPANFVQAGEDALACWETLKDRVVYFHIKDAIASNGRVVPAGEGDGHLEEILTDAVSRGFDGFLSLEPHLRVAGRSHGETGPELFKTAVEALRKVISKAGGEAGAA